MSIRRDSEAVFDQGRVIARRSFPSNIFHRWTLFTLLPTALITRPFSPLCRAIVSRETAASIRSRRLHNECRRFTTSPWTSLPPSRWIVVRETTNYRRVSSHPPRSIAFCLGNSPSCVPPPLSPPTRQSINSFFAKWRASILWFLSLFLYRFARGLDKRRLYP